jgi:hypothetical protein
MNEFVLFSYVYVLLTCFMLIYFHLHNIDIREHALIIEHVQMLPSSHTRNRPLARVEPSNTKRNLKPSSGNIVAQALNRVTEVLQHITGTNRREEHRLKTGEDQALERFL